MWRAARQGQEREAEATRDGAREEKRDTGRAVSTIVTSYESLKKAWEKKRVDSEVGGIERLYRVLARVDDAGCTCVSGFLLGRDECKASSDESAMRRGDGWKEI